MPAATTYLTQAVTDHIEAADITALVDARAWPSLTLLLDTSPADHMTMRDAERLDGLVVEAMTQMEDLGVAIFVSQALQRTYRLPQPVSARAVVEPTFATRDVLHALHRTPPHLLLLLEGMCAQFSKGFADT